MSNLRALIVDDSAFSRSIVAKFLQEERPAWSLDQAGDGEVALQQCVTNAYDLITIDMHMPKMNGLALAQALQERDPTTPLVLVTANVQNAVRERAEAMKLRFVAKPLTAVKIASVLAELSL